MKKRLIDETALPVSQTDPVENDSDQPTSPPIQVFASGVNHIWDYVFILSEIAVDKAELYLLNIFTVDLPNLEKLTVDNTQI